MDKKEVVFEEKHENQEIDLIETPRIDGFFSSKIKDYMLSDDLKETDIQNIFSNAINCLNLFRNVKSEVYNKPRKILCLGKVQSGKTSFFLTTIALAFDNNYDIAYVIGGTKNNLKDQNYDRIKETFANNDKIEIYLDLNSEKADEYRTKIKEGKKIIFVILKNAAKKVNLGALENLLTFLSDVPSVVVDDEGDEYTPGNAKKKKGAGNRTHDKICDIIEKLNICTYLSVTATPQANFLISTLDRISPDCLVLVKPGNGYVGGNDFFMDLSENNHISLVSDQDDFKDSIPLTFINALNDFIFACSLKRTEGDLDGFSMMIHPSSLSVIQNEVGERIESHINDLIDYSKSKNSDPWRELVREMKKRFEEYIERYPKKELVFESLILNIDEVFSNLEFKIVNYKNAVIEKKEEENKYEIVVGGNMLGRGLTINRLIVSYIYRDSKNPAVDTMYQRCRWFGYKKSYFDVCKVYLTKQLFNRFNAIVNHENYLWVDLEAFLDSNINIKHFNRVFELDDDDLLLTRKTISKTVRIKSLSQGHKQDNCTDISDEEKKQNRELFNEFFREFEHTGEYIDFDNSIDHRQQHLIIEIKYSVFYEKFLSKYKFGNTSKFTNLLFKKLLDNINDGNETDEITVMVMRPKYCEKRKPTDSTKITIDNLFQGFNENTNFTGDAVPVDIYGREYIKSRFIQIHLVKFDDSWKNENAFPMISFNNSISKKDIKLVTGDNYYESDYI